jgi:CelD/BcsL family acetyltransferase involved in cellulose biosynthesis
MQITLLDTPTAWEQIAGPWNDLLARSATDVPFLRFEFLMAWWATMGGGEWPDGELRIAVAREADGSLAAAAPLFTTLASPGTLFFVGTSEIADYLDLLAPPSALDRFADSLLAAVGRGSLASIDTLDLWNVLETSPSIPALTRAAAAAGWSIERERLKPCPLVSLEGGWEAYLQRLDKKQRHELRRKMRRVAQAPDARFHRASAGDSLAQDVEDFLGLMVFDGDKRRFLTPAMHAMFHALALDAARGGWLRLELLKVAHRPAAGAFCFDYGGRLLVYNSGMDPAYHSLSPGWALLGRLIQSAAEEEKTAVDFMRGDEDYKFRLGGQARYVERLTLRRRP